MARHRFGRGEYRYFAEPFPEPVVELKRALYPRLLPIARDWWTPARPAGAVAGHAGRVAGHVPRRRPDQVRPRSCCATGEGDWNALHRDLYGELVFPLQVVINLNDPGVDHTGGEFLLSSSGRGRSPGAPRR